MNVESLRCKKVKYFVESIGLMYCAKQKEFIQNLDIQVTEELKLTSGKEWDMHKTP